MADMHICDRCGKPTPNYTKYILGPIDGRDGCSVCDDCRKQRDRERAWENEQWHEDENAPGDPLRMAMREYWKEAEADGC